MTEAEAIWITTADGRVVPGHTLALDQETGFGLVQALGRLEAPGWTGSVSVHLFSFGVMGTIIPAMLIRISKGHTGRKVSFDALDRAVLYLMLAALALRIVAPQLLPADYLLWLQLAAACWVACFGILGWRYIPFLLRPRVDGKEH